MVFYRSTFIYKPSNTRVEVGAKARAEAVVGTQKARKVRVKVPLPLGEFFRVFLASLSLLMGKKL